MSEMSEAEVTAMMRELEMSEEKTEVPVVESKPEEKPPVRVGHETQLKRFVDPDKARKDIAIDPNDLDNAMMEHSSLYLHYAQQTVNARRQYDRLKSAFEILEARLDAEYRKSMTDSGKKPTEAAIRNALVADIRWSGAQSKVIEAGSIWRSCEIVESAMSQRKDMILEVARDRRKEKEGALRVLENQDMRERVLGMLSKEKAA